MGAEPPPLRFPLFGGGILFSCLRDEQRLQCVALRAETPRPPPHFLIPHPKILFGATEKRTNGTQILFISLFLFFLPLFHRRREKETGEIFTCGLELTLYICALSSPLSASVGTHCPARAAGKWRALRGAADRRVTGAGRSGG